MRVQTHAQAHAPTHPRTHAHMEVHQHTHTLTQELVDLYDMIEHTKKMGIRYVGNEVTDVFPGASAERQGVQPGWQIAVVCCMVHGACLMHDACLMHIPAVYCTLSARRMQVGWWMLVVEYLIPVCVVCGTAVPSLVIVQHARCTCR